MMVEDSSEVVENKRKAHRARHSGRKAEKKKEKHKTKNDNNIVQKEKNPKAFAFKSAVKAERRFRRKQDIETKKQHVPLIDRTPIEPPPLLVAVVGPPKVGKTTLITNLIKLFTKSPLTDIKGPVTIVTGKKRRITLIECGNDINCMIDLAKVADLVLLLCDASFGFEMEIFEFINICQVHGMPRIIGVLTHLDMIKNSKTLKNTKKTLKHRFWTEVYPGAKLFYLSGIFHDEYLKNEVKNLGRFISVIKLRPLTWRSSHSYLLADRLEDLTNQELIRQNPKCDRTISLYGYIRGVPLNKASFVHIAGLGDQRIHDVSNLNDPCPLPETIKKRALIEKEKLIYAPFSGVGGLVYDKDAVYVELGGSHSHTQRDEDSANVITNLIETRETLDVKMKHSELQLFTDSEKIIADDINDEYQKAKNDENLIDSNNSHSSKEDDAESEYSSSESFSEETHEETSDIDLSGVYNENKREKSKTENIHEKVSNVLKKLEKMNKSKSFNNQLEEDADEENYDEDNEEENLALKWKENLAKKAQEAFLERQNTSQNLMKLVYGVFNKHNDGNSQYSDNDKEKEEDKDKIGGLFKIVSKENQMSKIEKDTMNAFECSLSNPWNTQTKDWLEEDNMASIKDCFVTGKWHDSEDAEQLLHLDDLKEFSDSDSEMYGDFEDLETGKKFTEEDSKKGEKRKLEEAQTDDHTTENKKSLLEKKKRLKEKFDAEYDNAGEDSSFYSELKASAEKQAELNRKLFENMDESLRIQIEGYRPGMYVRIEFQNIPSEFVTNFDPTYPIVVGGLNMGEENIGFVNVKFKKHRWYKKILKANDPLIISLGWRRFQTLPLYSKLEDDLKYRYLKYTPQHVTCNAHFWGPITPQGTGFLAVQNVENNSEIVKQQGFRITATGSIAELDKSTRILKKLKLVGYPMKIYKKTAFIKGMFNSALEVAKFEGAKIKTVSGIRGQIKKAVNKEGIFRATFEDKIQLSDIVFCRTWFNVSVSKFYSPVTNLLLPPEAKNSWKGIKTVGQLKRERGLRAQPEKDSLYTEVVRQPKVFKPLVIPRKLEAMLPYRDKTKYGILSKDKKSVERVAVIREPYEQKVANMMKMLKTSYQHKQEQLKIAMRKRIESQRAEKEAEEARRNKKLREQKKAIMRARSKVKEKN